MTCETADYKMIEDELVDVLEPLFIQEEVGTILFLHALHTANAGSEALIIVSKDTNIMVICFVGSRPTQDLVTSTS